MVTTRSSSKVVQSDAGASSNGRKWEGKALGVNTRGSSRSRQSVEELEEEEEDEEIEELKKKRKKQHKSKKHSEAARHLNFADLPIDVLEDICSFFTPVDLLHLSRTSKAFFTLVDGADFNPVWIASRKLVNLPELGANDLSNLKYAALVYGDHCQVCGKKGRTLEDFFVRKRYCEPCKRANLIPVHEHVRKIKAHNFLYECALSSLHGGTTANLSKTVYYYFPSLIPLNQELNEISSRINALRPPDYRSIHSMNHMAVARRFKALLDKGEEDDEFEEDERELREFVTEKRELKECVQRDAEKLEAWQRSRPSGRW
ncbi:hypothetical protein JCM3765_001202 [Sporobolomyces pararoseus]